MRIQFSLKNPRLSIFFSNHPEHVLCAKDWGKHKIAPHVVVHILITTDFEMHQCYLVL